MVVEYANYLKSQGNNVDILTNMLNTVFKVDASINRISNSFCKIATILNAAVIRREYDVIVADIIVMIMLLSIRNRKKLVYFSQDYDESYYRGFFMRLLIRVLYVFCLKILKIPVIAVSDELGQLLRERFNANVTVVQNGVDMEVFYPDRDKEYLALKGNSKVIIVFARSDYRKGFDIAVEVLSRFNSEIDMGLISVWAVGEDITVPFKMKNFGFVSSEKLRKILSCSDVLLYPSRHEGLPLLVLEAMACECPVVTTKAVAFVKHNVDALQCDIGDTGTLSIYMQEILTNEILKKSINGGASKTLKRYDIKHSKRMFGNVLSHYIGI